MSDLDDDLLALAGDGVSDSEFEPQEPRKRSVSPVSTSKRRRTDLNDDEDEDDDEDDEVEETLINPYPLEGKYRDEDDRENLLGMDEIQREQTLFERSQEMESYNEKKYLQQRLKLQNALADGSAAKSTRSSARSKLVKDNAKSSKLDKLSELRKQREQKSNRERRQKDFDEYEDDEDDEDEEDDLEEGEDEERSEDDEYGYDEDRVVWGSGSSKSRVRRSTERADLKNINKIKVGRTLLQRFCFYNDFSDTIVDCFARINIGMDKRTHRPMYRMVQIVDVKNIPQKSYKFPTTKCDIYLTVAQNKTQKKDFPMNIFSDSPITQDEFERFQNELSKTGEELPYLDDVKDKYQGLHRLANREISDQDVNEMIKRKQELNSNGNNLEGFDAVFKKSKVKDQLKVALQENDIHRVSRLEKELEELEQIVADTTKNLSNSSSMTMFKVNERNRKLNQTNIRIAELKSSQLKKITDAKNDGGDAFSRLKTNTRIFYQDLVNEENEKAIVDARLNYEKELEEKNKKEAQIAASSYRCLGAMDEFIKKVDLDIDIQI